MKHIECAGGILQGLNDLFKTLFSGLDKLIKVDVDVKKSEEQKDGTLLMQIDIKNADKDILLVKAVPKDEDKTTYDVHLSERNGDRNNLLKNIKAEDLDDEISKIINTWYGEVDSETHQMKVENSSILLSMKRMSDGNLQLSRVQCASEDIPLLADAITTIATDGEFMDSVPTEDTVYELVPSEDAYNINPIDDCSCYCDDYNPFTVCIQYAKKLYEDVATIKWNAKGDICKIECMCNEFYYNLRDQIDALALYSCEEYGYAPDMRSCTLDIPGLDVAEGFCLDCAKEIICHDVQEYLDCLNMMYCNLPHHLQGTIDCWIRDFKESLLRIDRMTM